MTLTPVGQFQTVVNVNGTERVNTTQSDDQTYNITESLGADIQVNGVTEGSFTQTSDSVYNVQTSDTSIINRSATLKAPDSSSYASELLFETGSSIPITKLEYTITDRYGTGSGGVTTLESENGKIDKAASNVDEIETVSGTIQNPSFTEIHLRVYDETYEGTGDITVTLDVSNVNIDASVTQS